MPIDPNIALAVRVAPFDVRIPSPVDRYARMLSMRQLMGQSEAQQQLAEQRRFALEQSRLEAERQERARIRLGSGKELSTGEAYEHLGVTGAPTYLKSLSEREKAELEAGQQRNEAMTSIAGGILRGNNQQALERGVMDAMARGVIDQDTGHELIGLPWNDQTKAAVEQLYYRGIAGKEQHAMRLAESQEARAEELHVPQLAEAHAKTGTAQTELIARTAPEGQAAWDVWYARLPPDAQAQISPMYSDTERKRVQQLGLSQAQRETAKQAAATAARTEAHQKVMEGIARGQLGVAQQGLQLRQQEINRKLQDLTPAGQTQVQNMARQFDNRPEVKDYSVLTNKYQTLQNTINRGLGGPGDLVAIYEFMKALDPTSVVRESEAQSALKSGNIFAGWAARFNGAFSPHGGILPQQVKEDFLTLVGQKMDVSRNQVKGLYQDYARRIENIQGVEKGTGSTFLSDYPGIFEGPEAGKKSGGAKGGGKAASAEVQNVLKSAQPGIHTLSDGSKWRKNQDGSIQSAQ